MAGKEGADHTLKAGEVFLATWGEYSDYGVESLLRACVDFSVKEALARYEREVAKGSLPLDRTFSPVAFVKWLVVDAGLAEDVLCWEWHLGRGYGRVPEADVRALDRLAEE